MSYANTIKKSFSLIEVLIFVTILSIFLIAAAAIITATTRNNRTKVNMLKASHYNEQLLEWIRTQREIDWNVFTSYATVSGASYCFTSSTYSWSIDACSYDLDNTFKRYAILTSVGSPVSQIEVTVYTDWIDASNVNSSKLHTVYTVWEQ